MNLSVQSLRGKNTTYRDCISVGEQPIRVLSLNNGPDDNSNVESAKKLLATGN